MSSIEIGILGVIGLFVLMGLGMPIGVAMGLVGIIGLASVLSIAPVLGLLAGTVYTVTASFSVAVLPLFILMGEFAFVSGLSRDAYYSMHKWLGHLPGGLAMATIGGCAGFAAVCGSSTATAVTMGTVALPEMNKYKYNPKLSVGTLAAGGTLGILIPPSAAFVLYAIITEESIGKLFLAGVLPGILLACLFMITIYAWAKRSPLLAPAAPKSSWYERLSAVKGFLGVMILFLVVMGGIYGGVLSATEAAAMGAFCAFLIVLVRRRVTKETMIAAFMNTITTTGMVFIIIIGATLFGFFLTASGLPAVLTDFIAGLAVSPIVILILILVLFLILGCIMDAYAMLVVAVPIIFPVILRLGFDPIWFGVLTVIMMEMGLITPPVGMNVFVMKGVARDVPMYTIFRGLVPFVIAMAVCVAIIVAFPQIALFLPNTMAGRGR